MASRIEWNDSLAVYARSKRSEVLEAVRGQSSNVAIELLLDNAFQAGLNLLDSESGIMVKDRACVDIVVWGLIKRLEQATGGTVKTR